MSKQNEVSTGERDTYLVTLAVEVKASDLKQADKMGTRS